MKSLREYFKMFRLAHGGHDHPEDDGKACFMNVISYLTGGLYVNDHPESVCDYVREIIITMNDTFNDNERQQLMPYLERALNSTTFSGVEIDRRKKLLADFRALCAASSHPSSFSSETTTGNIFHHAYTIASPYDRQLLVTNCLEFLDKYLPAAVPTEELDPCILVRAERLEAAYCRTRGFTNVAQLDSPSLSTPASG